jgi:peptide subunit release factor 1 (eRF1)
MPDVLASSREIAALVARLGHVQAARPEVVTVCLNTQWSDEHQRDRTRVFLDREVRRARAAGVAAAADLDWIAEEGRMMVEQGARPDVRGVALFACQAIGLRERLSVRVPFEERFVVRDRPDVGALAALLDEHASAMVVFVDGESARLIPLHPTGAGEELRLEHTVPRHHRRGGWAQLAQSRYARHIETHRHDHYVAVADAVTHLVDAAAIRLILLAGHEDRLAAFGEHLPDRIRRLVVGQVHAMAWEPASTIAQRASERLDLQEHSDEVADVDAVLTEAAKGRHAVAGPGTLEAARRGAIHRLYLLAGLRQAARECEQCAALQDAGERCWLCGGPTRDVDLGTGLVDRVLASGGTVERIGEHAGLAAVGGVAARLRYPLSR